MDTVIETRDLIKRFGGKTAVDHLTLSVPRGAICALLGDNGAGKTTTIRMLTGLLPADAGNATILGQDSWSAASALRRRVAYVPEPPAERSPIASPWARLLRVPGPLCWPRARPLSGRRTARFGCPCRPGPDEPAAR